MAFDKSLLDILACPVCKGSLHYDKKNTLLVCKADRLGYPIREDIPVLLDTEASKLSLDQIESLDQ